MEQPQIVLLGIIAVIAALGGLVYKRFRVRALPRTSDEDFLRYFGGVGIQIPADRLLRERELVAAVLKIPAERLSPHQTQEDLRRLEISAADSYVAWSDLLDELTEDRDAEGLPIEEPPTTIGSLVQAFAEIDPAKRSRR